MPVLQLLTFHLPTPSAADTASSTALSALKSAKAPQNLVLGISIADKSTLQLTSEWHDVAAAETTPETSHYRQTILQTLGTHKSTLHVSLHDKDESSAFSDRGPLASAVVEFVKIYFPAHKVDDDAAFRAQIEADFEKFDAICGRVVRGTGGVRYGWVVEEQEHAEVEGRKCRCFLVARGWEDMGFFEEVLGTNEYKEAVQILLAWAAPWEMWHVKRQSY